MRYLAPVLWCLAAAAIAFGSCALVGCGGRSSSSAEPVECHELEWSPDWCDARSSSQFVMVCEGGERGELGSDGVWSGAPFPACAPAEHRPELDAWCCWGKP